MHEQELTKLKSEAAVSGSIKQPVQMSEDQYSTLISRMFMGKVVTTFKCLACHNESKHVELFTDLSLAFPEDLSKTSATKNTHSDNQRPTLVGGAVSEKSAGQKAGQGKGELLENVVTLEDLLSHYLRAEKLKGDNKYYCDVCKHLQDGERFIYITSPPEYLNLTLLRFSYSVKAKARAKIFTDVRYPKILRLPVHREIKTELESNPDCSDRIKKYKKTVPAAKGESSVTYALCAVIIHSGYSSDSGHYYCYARHNTPVELHQQNPQDEHQREEDCNEDILPDQWYLFNDSRVTYSRYESFCNITKTFGKDTPYVLFYKKIYPQGLSKSVGNIAMDISLPLDLRAAVDQDNRLFLQVIH